MEKKIGVFLLKDEMYPVFIEDHGEPSLRRNQSLREHCQRYTL